MSAVHLGRRSQVDHRRGATDSLAQISLVSARACDDVLSFICDNALLLLLLLHGHHVGRGLAAGLGGR